MPERRKLTESVTQAGKKVLATDAAQDIVGTIANAMQEVAKDKALDVFQTVKERVAKAGGRKPPTRKSSSSMQEMEQIGGSTMSTVKEKAGDAASAVGSGAKTVGSEAKTVGSGAKKAVGAVAQNPLVAATSAAALGTVIGGAALVRQRRQKAKRSSVKSPSRKKSPAKRSSTKKSSSKRTSAKKSIPRKSPARKRSPSSSSKRSGPKRSNATRKRSSSRSSSS